MSLLFGSLLRHCVGRSMGRAAILSLGCLVLVSCSAKHYRKSADKETYTIIQQYHQAVFGHTNAFNIETAYSQRDPQTIPPAEIIGDRSASNRASINLEQALEMSLKQSREYQTQKEQLYLTALTLTGARWEFSPQFFAGATPQIAGTPSGAQVGSVSSKLGVGQLLKTGGSLTMSLANDLVRYFTGKPDLVARNSAINTLSVNLTQPLLRGFGINNPAVESLTQAERNVVYAIRSYSLYQQQFAVETVNGYFALLSQKDIVRNNYRNYTNRVETTMYLEARAVDRERTSSVEDARNAQLSAKKDYINSLAAYLTALDGYKLRLGLPIGCQLFLDDRDLDALIQAGLTPLELSPKAAFELCVEKQMEILNAIDRFEDSKRKIKVSADRLRAELNLFADAKLSSDSPDDYTKFDPDKVRYTAGVTLNLPLDRQLERNNYRATLVSFESQLRSLALTLDNYKDRIERGMRTMEQTRLNYIVNVESLKNAERRLENNVMLLEAGRATVRDVREAQDGLIEAQNNLSSMYPVYLTARLNLLLNIGVIDTQPAKFWLLDPLKDRLSPQQMAAPPLRMPGDQVPPPQQFFEPTS